MTTKTNVSIAEVLPTCKKLCDGLSDACIQIEIAGSIRRKKKEVGDIELVAIPIRAVNLLGDVDQKIATQLDRRLRQWEADGRIVIAKFGPKYKQFILKLPNQIRINVDLFLTTPECWPVIFAIRTGPWQYSKAFVTSRASGGLLQNGCYVSEGRLWQERSVVDLRDERHFFEYVQGGYLEPEKRCAP